MKIAVDCADLDHARIDGTRVYIKQLLDHFGALDDKSEFLLYHRQKFNPELTPKNWPNYQERKIPYPYCWTQTRLAYELAKDRPDVCWMPIQQIPLVGPKSIKYIVTIHDLGFKYFPESFPLSDRLKIDFFTQAAIRRADKIIAISNSTKKDILKFYPKTPENKITVVYHGFDQNNFSHTRSDKDIGEVLERYKIIKINDANNTSYQLPATSYILYVGAIQPRKNLITLVEAFEKLKKSGHENLKLVFAGEIAWKAEKTLRKIRSSRFLDDIFLTGKVGFDELATLYQGASAFVYPSLYEGFGIPILEAMASGTPVVVADNSSLVEIGAEAVLKFKEDCANDLADKLKTVLDNSQLKNQLISKGRARCEQFSWDKCARNTLEILKVE